MYCPPVSKFAFAPVAVAAAMAVVALTLPMAHAQQTKVASAAEDNAKDSASLPLVMVSARRANRVSKGATNLSMEVKETPQSISIIDSETMRDFAATSSNEALQYSTGLTVDEWETNRTTYRSRGFDVMLTQVDGLGMSNEWGIAEGHMDTYLFDQIELVRGANGLLTGVGNASGTINYIRKRPTGKDGGEALVTLGSYAQKRVAMDYNKVLSKDGLWAGRLVLLHDDRDSYLRALGNQRTALSAIVEGPVGDDGVLTLGLTHQESKQRSPMWGSLTLPYANGSLAEFDVSASTSQDWTRWDHQRLSAFVEYVHAISPTWEAKFTLNHAEQDTAGKLFYAYTSAGYLNNDNTGLVGWPYRFDGKSSNDNLDINLSGQFDALGRQHEAVFGLNHSKQASVTESYSGATFPVMPSFPYAGNVFPEPTWGAKAVAADGDQTLTRFYAAGRLQLTDRFKGIVGLNAIKLKRDGTAIYGGGTNLDNEITEKVSPYLGATYDLTPDALAYASYSDIFQAQDQRDINGAFLKPMKGVNTEIGVKAEWLNHKLLTTFAIFDAEQNGLATEAGFDTIAQQSYYAPKDVKARGFEIEIAGHVNKDTKLTAGFTAMKLTGADGKDIYEWIPRRTLKVLADTRIATLPKLRVGSGLRWQSDISKIAGARQDAYVLVDTFAAYELTDKATVRLNVNNFFDKKYIRSVSYGAIYGSPRTASLTLEYKL